MQFSFDTNLNRIAEKVEANDRLTFEDGIDLYNTEDLNALGKSALQSHEHLRRGLQILRFLQTRAPGRRLHAFHRRGHRDRAQRGK
jgi:2-iminoacetate synthase ThiH